MKFTVFVLLAWLGCGPAWSIMPFAKTPAEEKLCSAKILGRDQSDTKNWMHMHHYCDGLRYYSRALANTSNRPEFTYYISQSIAEFNYVLQHTTPDFYMRAEVNAEKARSLVLAGRKAEAVSLYSSVVQQSPDFIPAYLFLADYYASGNRSKALDLVSQGLRHNPGTKSLQRRYRELGGKLPYPEALVKTEPAINADQAIAPDAVKPEAPAEPKAATDAAPAATATDGAASTPAPTTTKIGTPKNPYCRFCVD